MKAAVITLHTVCNYGTQLQLYATQEKLKQYFDEVYFIDYRRPDTYGTGLLKTFSKGNPIRGAVAIPTVLYWEHVFGKFLKKYISLSENKYLKKEDFSLHPLEADVFFSGSDQVWNTGWNGGIIPALYLDFVPDNRPKYAYASSFGRSKLNPSEVSESKQYINKYKKISVREESGLKILREQYGFLNATRLVDPTLAMPPSFWRKMAPPAKIKGNYILIYNLNRNRKFDDYAKELSKRTGLRLYRFCTRFDQIFRNGKSILIPEIFEFITLIDHAQLVLTDSFHATAFSMNMNTEPVCVYPNDYAGRISEFLKLVDSEQRHAQDYDDFDVVNRHVDFTKVNEILETEREKTDHWLKEVYDSVRGNRK